MVDQTKAGAVRPKPTGLQLTDHSRLVAAIEYVPVDVLRPYERNARVHDARQVLKLAAIIKRAGFLVPMIVDQDNVIVAGHGRWLAAKEIGLGSVPVIRASHLSEYEVRAFRLADNRMSELSSWDKRARALELKDLVTVDLDQTLIDLSGFDMGEIDVAITSLDATGSGDVIDTVPDAPQTTTIRAGDLFRLGRHSLYCGSALEQASYDLLLDGVQVRASFSDPPYNVPIKGHVSGLGEVQHREFVQASGEMSEGEFISFLQRYLTLTRNASMPGALHYACMDAAHTLELLLAGKQAGLTFKTTCTWAKTNAGMGSLYRQQTEFVHVFKNGDNAVPHLNNIQLGRFGRNRTTLWSYPGVNTFRKGRAEDLADHPTVKPWALVADAIRDCSKSGDAVLDAFCGSGTTLLAAQKTDRVGYGIELDPLYVEVAIRRFQKLTGEQAIHATSGLTFDDLMVERHADDLRACQALSGEGTHG